MALSDHFTRSKPPSRSAMDAAQAADLRRQEQILQQRHVIDRLLQRNRVLEQALKDAGVPLPPPTPEG